jgi:PIN domain nuclease of toxin-antitoxin system
VGGASRLKLLLDTHIWIWSALEPDHLSRSVSKALADPANEIWISPISIWEILLLSQKKRLTLQPDAEGFLSDALSRVPLKEATFTHEVALATPQVILHHHDPADRFLAASAKVYGLTLVTSDRHLLAGKGFSVLANR